MTTTPTYDSLSEPQRCKLLARAMGCHYEPPDNMIEMSGDFPANPRPSDPNPFVRPGAYRALRRWADGQSLAVETASRGNALVWHTKEPRDGVVLCAELDYDASCHAVIKAIGLVLGLWT